jgi:hypothetical protein
MTATNGAQKKPRKPKAPHPLKGGSLEANRIAVAILEVLSGLRTPTDAAGALEVSLPRYYQLEVRALEGLVGACESRKKGRQMTLESQLARLQTQLAQARAETARQQALVRAAQRSIGLKPPVAADKQSKPGGKPKRRRRRPTVRALKAIAVLEENSRQTAEASVQTNVPDTDLSAAGSPHHARTQDERTTAGPTIGRLRAGKATARSDPEDADRRTDDRRG